MRYIQRRGDGYLETVDEFTTYRKAFGLSSALLHFSGDDCRKS